MNGNLAAAALALFQAITRAGQLGDVSSEVYFATWLANGMSVNGMADRALQLLYQATDLAREERRFGIAISISDQQGLGTAPAGGWLVSMLFLQQGLDRPIRFRLESASRWRRVEAVNCRHALLS